MHHGHVKRKEKQMNTTTLEEFQNDPALRRRLYAEAHRERSRAVRAGLAWLGNQITARFKPRQPARWIARLG
jgi:heme oxygenase